MEPESLNRRQQRLYIYNGRFSQNVKTVTGIGPVYEPTIKFYILADEFLMLQAVKTATLEAFVKACALSSFPMNKAEIEFVLNRTANDCPMRELVIDTFSRDFLGNRPGPGLARLLSQGRVIRANCGTGYGHQECR